MKLVSYDRIGSGADCTTGSMMMSMTMGCGGGSKMQQRLMSQTGGDQRFGR